jgi:hypothetical protein
MRITDSRRRQRGHFNRTTIIHVHAQTPAAPVTNATSASNIHNSRRRYKRVRHCRHRKRSNPRVVPKNKSSVAPH